MYDVTRMEEVNNPLHYAAIFEQQPISCIDITEHMDFLAGNAFKYIWRAGRKGDPLTDINKACWYMERLAWHTEERRSEKARMLFGRLCVPESEVEVARYRVLKSIVCSNQSLFEMAVDDFRRLVKGGSND